MTTTNYLRVLKSAKCLECNYDGYDSEFEKTEMSEIKKGTPPTPDLESNILAIMTNSLGEYQIQYQRIICPQCGVSNKCKIEK